MEGRSDTPSGIYRTGVVEAGRQIELESFRIIDSEMGDHPFPADRWSIVRRVIHTTGDFDYANWIRFHERAIDAGVAALRKGASIFTDTRMIQAGLSASRLAWFGNEVVTPASNPESQRWAEEAGTTRSVAAFRNYSPKMQGGIIAIGNAPTALLEIMRSIREQGIRPAVVIGVPVGFVQAVESKQALWDLTDQAAITVLGRKGGSAIAVAILHALLELSKDPD